MLDSAQNKITQRQELKIGDLLVNEGFVRHVDVEAALEIQRQETNHSSEAHKDRVRTIGEILCALDLITPLDLNAVLNKYHKHLELSEILVRKGVIDETTLSGIIQEARNSSIPIGKFLLEKGLITETELCSAYSIQYNLPFKTDEQLLLTQEHAAQLSNIIIKQDAQRLQVVPVALNKGSLQVAIYDPESLQGVSSLRARQFDYRVGCILVTKATFNRLFEATYDSPVIAPLLETRRPSIQEPKESSTHTAENPIYAETLDRSRKYREAIKRLHSAYERLAISKGFRSNPSDPTLFDRFIQQHFDHICNTYRCSRVSFSIIDYHNRIIIAALPAHILKEGSCHES